MMKRFLVAIPVFNERAYVVSIVEEVRSHWPDVLVVDDGSTDGTTECIRRLPGIHRRFHSTNRGYGQAVITAFEFAVAHDYDWLITLDCDDQHEPALIPRFIQAAMQNDADVISGSRYLIPPTDPQTAPPDRRRINRVITTLLNRRLGLELTDAFCGFKAYRVDRLRGLALDVPGYAMPIQFWVQAVRHELRIRELPVPLIYTNSNRRFGGGLDDPDVRLAYYLDVLIAELLKTKMFESHKEEDRTGLLTCP